MSVKNRKLFNSKNISTLIEKLIQKDRIDLVMQIINLPELKNILPNILETLKRKNIKIEDYNEVKIYSKTSISKETIDEIAKTLKIETQSARIIIDKNMSSGIKVKARDRMIDASLETMLRKGLEELLEKTDCLKNY